MPTLKVNFKSPDKANEFVKHFGVVGIKAKTKIDGSSVSITSTDAKTHDFVKQMVSDLKSEAKMESIVLGFLDAIVEAANNSVVTEATLLDESRVSIDPEFATKFIKIHDGLSEESGQAMLRFLATESMDSFNKTKTFVTQE
jgi:hypothetical protein